MRRMPEWVRGFTLGPRYCRQRTCDLPWEAPGSRLDVRWGIQAETAALRRLRTAAAVWRGQEQRVGLPMQI